MANFLKICGLNHIFGAFVEKKSVTIQSVSPGDRISHSGEFIWNSAGGKFLHFQKEKGSQVIWKSTEDPTDIEYALNKFQKTNSLWNWNNYTQTKYVWVQNYFSMPIFTRKSAYALKHKQAWCITKLNL